MNKFTLIILLLVTALALGCSKSKSEQLIGIWKNTKEATVIEYREDGTWSTRGTVFAGKWELNGRKLVNTAIINGEAYASNTNLISFKNGRLFTTDDTGKTGEYIRLEE